MATAAPAATAKTPEGPEPVPVKGKKKLILIIVAALVVVLALVAVAAVLLLKKPAAEHEGEDGEPVAAASQVDPKTAPVFVPLDPFTVNLADRQAERYAQVGITLELEDAATTDRIKAFMPAIRNNILMAIADRTAGELIDRDGKTQLAERVRQEASRALGYEVDDPEPAAEDGEAPAKKRKKKAGKTALPIKAVHFSNFIIQ